MALPTHYVRSSARHDAVPFRLVFLTSEHQDHGDACSNQFRAHPQHSDSIGLGGDGGGFAFLTSSRVMLMLLVGEPPSDHGLRPFRLLPLLPVFGTVLGSALLGAWFSSPTSLKTRVPGWQAIVMLLISQPLCPGQEKGASNMHSFLGVESETAEF